MLEVSDDLARRAGVEYKSIFSALMLRGARASGAAGTEGAGGMGVVGGGMLNPSTARPIPSPSLLPEIWRGIEKSYVLKSTAEAEAEAAEAALVPNVSLEDAVCGASDVAAEDDEPPEASEDLGRRGAGALALETGQVTTRFRGARLGSAR